MAPFLEQRRAEAPTIKASASSTWQAFCDEIGQAQEGQGHEATRLRGYEATRLRGYEATRYDLRLEPESSPELASDFDPFESAQK